MAVASPPKKPAAKKTRKHVALPPGMEQSTLEGLFAASPEAPEQETPPAPAMKTQPVVEPVGKPGQLGFDSLTELSPIDGGVAPGQAVRTDPLRNAGTGSVWEEVSRSA